MKLAGEFSADCTSLRPYREGFSLQRPLSILMDAEYNWHHHNPNDTGWRQTVDGWRFGCLPLATCSRRAFRLQGEKGVDGGTRSYRNRFTLCMGCGPGGSQMEGEWKAQKESKASCPKWLAALGKVWSPSWSTACDLAMFPLF